MPEDPVPAALRLSLPSQKVGMGPPNTLMIYHPGPHSTKSWADGPMTHPIGITNGGGGDFQKILLNPEPLPKNPNWPCLPTVGSPSLVTPPSTNRDLPTPAVCLTRTHCRGCHGDEQEGQVRVHTAVCEHTRAGSTHPWIFDWACSHGAAAPRGDRIPTGIYSPCGGLLAHACAHAAVCVLMTDVLLWHTQADCA